MLLLVRHGRPLLDRRRPPAEWDLDPAGFDDVWALRTSGRLPSGAAWYSSPEPKAQQTAQLLTDHPVGVVDGLREQVRATKDRPEDFDAVVRRAFAEPSVSAYEGWEPLETCRARVATAVRGILAVHPEDDVVLVGHATAWTLVVADLTGAPPDLDRWRRLAMPDVLEVEPPSRDR